MKKGILLLPYYLHDRWRFVKQKRRSAPALSQLLMRQLKIDVLFVLVVTDKLMFVVIGARDFSPEITVHLIGTKVPCFDKVPPPQIQFIDSPTQILGYMC